MIPSTLSAARVPGQPHEVSGRLPDRAGRQDARGHPAASFDVEFLVESRPLARRLHDAGIERHAPATPRRTDTYLKADLAPTTCVIVEDNGRRSLQEDPRRRSATRAARWSTCSAWARGDAAGARTRSGRSFPDVSYLPLAELFGGPLVTEFSRSLTTRPGAAVPAVLQRRRPRADPAAQRPGSRRDGQRPGAAQPAAPHEGHRHPRRAPGRDAAREPADGQPARHPGRAPSRRRRSREFDRIAIVDVQPHYFGGTARPRRPRHRPPPAAAGLQRGLQGHPRRTTARPPRSSPSTCARST